MKYAVTFRHCGLCYITSYGGDNWCEWRLSTNPKKKELFNTKQAALRSLKEIYKWRNNRPLRVPHTSEGWNIIEIDLLE
jgi:hypothetical protein